jgi:TolA-binding protein
MDLRAELKNFKPIDLEEIVQAGEKIPDNIRNSVFLYNKAIESLRSGSEDIAMIGLRKAISMNPNFNEAHNLLGICYSYVGETEKAAEMFNKVSKTESNGVLAMSYMRKFGMIEEAQQQADKQTSKQSLRAERQIKRSSDQTADLSKRLGSGKYSRKETKTKKQYIFDILKILVAFAAGLALYAVIQPPMKEPEDTPVQPDKSAIEAAVNEVRAEYDSKLAEMSNKIALLQKDKDNALAQADYYKTSLRLYEIESLVADKKYQDAADVLLLMKTVEYEDAEKEKFDNLYVKVMPLAAKAAYDQGYKLYNSRNYPDSLKSFERVQVYDPEYKRMDAVLYYMGRCNQFADNSRTATALFQRLIDNYPKSSYVKNAKVRLNELTKIP